MRLSGRVVWVFVVGVLCLLFPARGQPGTPEQAAALEDSIRMRRLTVGMFVYMQEHGDQLPPDLQSLSPYLTGDLSKASAQERENAIRESFMTAQDRGVKIPADADAAWLAKNSSYVYLAGAGFKSGDLMGWERLAVAHLKFDKGLAAEPTPGVPDGLLFNVAFMDSHVELLPRAEAEAIVAESVAVFEAIKTGKPLPEAQQVLMDLRVVMEAIRKYSEANKGELPPDLGAAFAFVRTDSKRFAKASDRAKVFLSARAKASTHVPEEPTAEWVNEKTSWVYLGAKGAKLADIEDPRSSILVHGKFDSPMEYARGGIKGEGIPLVTVSVEARVESEEYARWIAAVSRQVVGWATSGTPLPEHLNAHRDVRVILGAILAFSKEHREMLPPDLGAVLPYVLPDAKTEERAKLFLSPAKERDWTGADELTPEWVKSRSSYVYLPQGIVELRLVREAGVDVLLHGPLDEPYDVHMAGSRMRVVAAGLAVNYTWMTPVEAIERMINESRDTLKHLVAATPQAK